MTQKFSNAARAELATTINTTDTTINIVGLGDLFPVANTGNVAIHAGADWFKLTLQDNDGYEIVFVRTHTASSNTFSDVLRGQEGTTARGFTAGSVVGLRPTAGDAQDTADHITATQTALDATVKRLDVGASPAQVPAGQHLGKLAYMDELAALRATLTQPQAIGAVWVERVSDTSIKLFMRGSDGVARSTTLTLS